MIKLRALEPEDLEFLYALENDESLWYLGTQNTPFSKDILNNYLQNAHLDIYTTKQFRFVIQKDSKAIGTIDLFEFDPKNRKAGVGIVISSSERQKNYGTSALMQLAEYAKDHLHLHQLFATIPASNSASIRLFENCGFVKCGEKKDWILNKNTFENAIDYQLIL